MAQDDSSDPPALMAGTRLDSGRYELERELGRGGFGTVYLATQILPFRRQVVIKVPHARLLEDESAGFAERFRSEIGHLAELEHPSIVKIFGAGVESVRSGTPVAPCCFAIRRRSWSWLRSRTVWLPPSALSPTESGFAPIGTMLFSYSVFLLST